MPSFVVEFESQAGPERRLFTLDDDRALDTQLRQVIEELRGAGRAIRGGAGDELEVLWNGRVLDGSVPLHALGIDVSRPLVLRMRPRAQPAPPPATPRRFTMRQYVIPPVEGAIGGVVAWWLSGSLVDGAATSTLIAGAGGDPFAAGAFALCVAAPLAAGNIARGLAHRPLAIVSVALSLLVCVLVWPALAPAAAATSARAFLPWRVLAWMLLAVGVAVVATIPLRETGRQRFLEAALLALFGGVLASLVASLPGSSELWRAVAFAVGGAAVGSAGVSLPVWRAAMNERAVVAT